MRPSDVPIEGIASQLRTMTARRIPPMRSSWRWLNTGDRLLNTSGFTISASTARRVFHWAIRFHRKPVSTSLFIRQTGDIPPCSGGPLKYRFSLGSDAFSIRVSGHHDAGLVPAILSGSTRYGPGGRPLREINYSPVAGKTPTREKPPFQLPPECSRMCAVA
jgi:hypothetical protein